MNPKQAFTSSLGSVITRFLALKQALGRYYDRERRIMQSLDRFLVSRISGETDITPDAFAQWCSSLYHLSPTVRRNHMRIVRNLCLYRRRHEPTCFVPDKNLFPQNNQSLRPHIFSVSEVGQLLRATRTLQPISVSPLYPQVLRLAVVLLFTTGIRRRELVRLTIGDYDHHERTLFIRLSKFHKSRILPLSPDGSREVENYLQKRRALNLPSSPEKPLLWNGYAGGRGYSGGGIGEGLRRLLRATGIHKPDGRVPRTHDFRHAFAVNALLRWYRAGEDVQAKLPFLAVYMGHVSIVSTQYYLHFIEDITKNANARFERYCGTLINPKPEMTGGKQ
ncbi:MAG: tyrosine-type recombinase/integrase [Bacteroidota bacterium]